MPFFIRNPTLCPGAHETNWSKFQFLLKNSANNNLKNDQKFAEFNKIANLT
jgi:hypothetical protein